MGQMTLAINRFAAVFFPFQTKIYWTNKGAFISWLITSLLYPFIYFFVGYWAKWVRYPIDPVMGDCSETDYVPYVRYIRITANIYLPMAVSLLMYILIIGRVMISPMEQRANMRDRAKGCTAMFACTLFYTLCVMPLWISFGASDYANNIERTLWIKYLFRCSYAINPVSSPFDWARCPNTLICSFTRTLSA